ncbi:BBSome-interacting protein 1 [Toxocara canis]|uniref:BBSome-interacting protein 1 n=1 Tax=Toxocara canis TaxID=6265 RepID=A0A0B2W1E4_TOXCA|nr:BBSome-interacting protein 1 [Toxocara canis]
MASTLKEVLGAHNGVLFKEEALSPVFCKPKLIPLKSVTLEKLEQMQRDSMAKILELEQKLKNDIEADEANAAKERPEGAAEQTTNIWTADDNETDDS